MDGSIIISPAIEFLIRKLFRRPTEIDRTSSYYVAIVVFFDKF